MKSMRIRNSLNRIWLVLWLVLCGACSPAVVSVSETCAPTIQSVASESVYPPLVVNQGFDATGRPYQSFRVAALSPVETHTTEDVSSPTPSYSFSVYVNNHRQPVLVWNSTAVGLWRVEQLPTAQTQACGFGYELTIGTTSNGPCSEVVCRGLQDRDVIQLRVDVCNWRTGECMTGETLLTEVTVLPL